MKDVRKQYHNMKQTYCGLMIDWGLRLG